MKRKSQSPTPTQEHCIIYRLLLLEAMQYCHSFSTPILPLLNTQFSLDVKLLRMMSTKCLSIEGLKCLRFKVTPMQSTACYPGNYHVSKRKFSRHMFGRSTTPVPLPSHNYLYLNPPFSTCLSRHSSPTSSTGLCPSFFLTLQVQNRD